MASSEPCSKLLAVEIGNALVSKCKLKLNNKLRRNRNRKLRRKRKKLKYTQKLSTLSIKKRSQEIREQTLSVYDFTDDGMEQEQQQQSDYFPIPPKDVTNWQYNHQLCYWKSRAISLEYENRMLHAHIKKMCNQEIQNYVDYVKKPEENICKDDEIEENEESLDDANGISENSEETSASENLSEKKVLYGDMQSKINGMEMAMEVNYNMNIDKYKPKMWPNIALNL